MKHNSCNRLYNKNTLFTTTKSDAITKFNKYLPFTAALYVKTFYRLKDYKQDNI